MQSLIFFNIGNSTCRQLLKFTIKCRKLLLLNLWWLIKERPKTTFSLTLLSWMPGHNNCVWTLVHLHYTSQFHMFQGNHQSLQWNVSGMCMRLTPITFPVSWSSVLILQWLAWRYCGLDTFFRINNTELLKIFVCRCRKYHKSWWNGAAELHNSIDLISGTTGTPSFTTRR